MPATPEWQKSKRKKPKSSSWRNKEKETQDQQEAINPLERKNQKLENRGKSVRKELEKSTEELQVAEKLYSEVNRRLQKAIADEDMTEMSVVQGLVAVATKKMEPAQKNVEKNQKEKKELDRKH